MKKWLSKYPKIIWCLRNLIPMFLFPVANFYLFEWYTHNPWETMKVPIQFLNIYFFELLMMLFLFVFGRLKWSLRLQKSDLGTKVMSDRDCRPEGTPPLLPG